MISTEETVRETIVAKLKSIAERDLGFDATAINVKDYLIEHEQRERLTKYLRATSNGRPVLRAIGVHVVGSDDFFATGGVQMRTYRITIQSYQEIGLNGEGVKFLVQLNRKIMQAIRSMTVNLEGSVSRVQGVGELDIARVPTDSAEVGEMLVGTFIIEAIKTNPDY